MRKLMLIIFGLLVSAASPAAADPMLADFEYPFPVKQFAFESQGQQLSMAYMDISPAGIGNGRTAVLMHGKNFCGATWEATILALREDGFRVVVPDQIGFCKSTKPDRYQYGLHQLAANTHALLQAMNVTKPVIVGHSMGGMLAFRYALMYGDEISALVVVNPIGLEDWKALGVPIATIDQLYSAELKTTAEKIRAYQRNTYYDGHWRPEYNRWVEMLAGMYRGKEGAAVAWSQALTSDMIFNQPVVYEFGNITAPTLLLIGSKDNTAIGKARAPGNIRKHLGNYSELGPKTAKAIDSSVLVMFDNLGHSPQVQAPKTFNEALIVNLEAMLAAGPASDDKSSEKSPESSKDKSGGPR
jgi:pimeloyl-ACP methyl ester carboxylesterase